MERESELACVSLEGAQLHSTEPQLSALLTDAERKEDSQQMTDGQTSTLGLRTENNELERVLDYLDRGWVLTEVHDGEKPLIREEVATAFASSSPPLEFAVLTGDLGNGLVDVRLNSEEARKLAYRLLPPTEAIIRESDGPCDHWLYMVEGSLDTCGFVDPEHPDGADSALLELRGNGTLTPLPTSSSDPDVECTWYSEGDPATVPADILRSKVGTLAGAALLARYWDGTIDSELLTSVMFMLISAGWTDEQAEGFACAVRETAQDLGRLGSDPSAEQPDVASQADEPVGIADLSTLLPPAVATRVREWLGIPELVPSVGVPEPSQYAELASYDRDGWRPDVVSLANVQREDVRWLWSGRIPLGKITLIDGDPETGKSLLTADIAARVTNGLPFPDGGVSDLTEPASVLFIPYEDDVADTIVPRLTAAGADLTRVLSLTTLENEDGSKRLVSIPNDLDHVRTLIEQHGVKLIVIDPLMAAINSRLNSHKDQDVRQALAPVSAVAQQTGAAFVFVRHLNKSESANALLAGGGSIGIVGAARSALYVGKASEDGSQRVLAVEKSNLDKRAPSLAFSVKETECGSIVIAWQGEIAMTANELLAATRTVDETSRLDEAKEFLHELFKEDKKSFIPTNDIIEAAREHGISERTLKRAKAELGIERKRSGYAGDGVWYWMWPVGR